MSLFAMLGFGITWCSLTRQCLHIQLALSFPKNKREYNAITKLFFLAFPTFLTWFFFLAPNMCFFFRDRSIPVIVLVSDIPVIDIFSCIIFSDTHGVIADYH